MLLSKEQYFRRSIIWNFGFHYLIGFTFHPGCPVPCKAVTPQSTVTKDDYDTDSECEPLSVKLTSTQINKPSKEEKKFKKKTVTFSKTIRVKTVPSRETYDSEKCDMFWSPSDLELFRNQDRK